MKIKHNKKRNTAFIYESLIKEAKSELENLKEQKFLDSNLMKDRFKNIELLELCEDLVVEGGNNIFMAFYDSVNALKISYNIF